MTIARDLGYPVRGGAAPPPRPLPRRRGVPHRHRGRGGADPLGRRPRDRRPRARSPASSRRRTSPPCAARSSVQGLVGVCPLNDVAAVRDPSWPERVEIYDTTLRDGSQLEGISLTVDDKLRIAEQLDWLGVDFIEAGWPGANPKDDEFFRRAPTRAARSTRRTLVAFGSTRRVKGKVDSDDTLRNLLAAGTSTVCIVGKSWDYHVLEALSTTLDEGVAMVADSVAFLHGRRPRRVLRRRALLRRLPPQPRVRPARARGCGAGGRDPPRAVRHERRHAARRGRAHRARGRRLLRRRRRRRACTSTTTPAPAWPTRSRACAAARSRCRARSTATASAPATATSPRSSRTSR